VGARWNHCFSTEFSPGVAPKTPSPYHVRKLLQSSELHDQVATGFIGSGMDKQVTHNFIVKS
jgi:hypothetical protein